MGKGKGNAEQTAKDDPAESADIDPKLEKIVDDWCSSGTESPLLLPTYLPFRVAEVSPGPLGSYIIWSSESGSPRPLSANVQIHLVGSTPAPSGSLNLDTITIDGRSYPYSERPPYVQEGLGSGQYAIMPWMKSERGKEYMYSIQMNSAMDRLPPEEFAKTIASMRRMDPPERTSSPKKDESSRKR